MRNFFRAAATAVHKSLRAAVPAGGLVLLAGLGLLFAGYVLAFATTLHQPVLRSIRFAAINALCVCPAALLRCSSCRWLRASRTGIEYVRSRCCTLSLQRHSPSSGISARWLAMQ